MFAVGTRVPGLFCGGAAPSFVPVSGLTQSMSFRSRFTPVGPCVPSQASMIRSGFAGSPKLCQDRTQPVCSGAEQAASPIAGKSAVVLSGQPTT